MPVGACRARGRDFHFRVTAALSSELMVPREVPEVAEGPTFARPGAHIFWAATRDLGQTRLAGSTPSWRMRNRRVRNVRRSLESWVSGSSSSLAGGRLKFSLPRGSSSR